MKTGWAAAFGAAWLSALPVLAQTYPTRPIRMVTASPVGSMPDLTARLLAERLVESLGQPIVIDNRPGAGGLIAAELGARAAPDGYTLTLGHVGSHGTAPGLHPKLRYHPVRDFAHISLVASSPNMLVVHPSLPVKGVGDLVALAKARPAQLLYASGGNGTSAHLSMELFKSMARIDLVHIPYKGASAAIADVVAGQAVAFIGNMPPAVPLVNAGRLRALAVTTAKRSPLLPELPTVAESGFPGFETVAWFALFAPAGTPEPMLKRLSQSVQDGVRTPQMRAQFAKIGAEAIGSTSAELRAHIEAEVAKWTALTRKLGVRVE